MSSSRRRSARPDPARRRTESNLEALESRQLLTQSSYFPINSYPLSDTLPFKHPGMLPAVQISHPIGTNPAILAGYQNEGRNLSGQDRQGNRWNLVLTGPGAIIVTDTSPNDGVLDDNLNTIRLVGTNPKTSVLTGTVEQSARVMTDTSLLPTLGTLYFNSLQAQQGVRSIILNGFILTDTITPPGSAALSDAEISLNQTTGINLHGGVSTLSFEGIDARFPTGTFNPVPINVLIGNPTTPLTVHPNIRIDHIYNTMYDNTAFAKDPLTGLISAGTIPTGPLTTPSLSLIVNGTIQNFEVVSITQQPNLSTLFPPVNDPKLVIPTPIIPSGTAALQYQFPITGTTGRTSIQTNAVGNIRVSGAATNITFSKAAKPFQNGLTGLNSVGSAQFGGTADAVAIDARGNIGPLKFAKGLGNPVGSAPTATVVKSTTTLTDPTSGATSTTTTTTYTPILNPIYYGQPASQYGYAATGNIAVQITTQGNIGSLTAGPTGQFFQISQDPAQIQTGLNGYTTFVNRPGAAVTSSLVAAAGSIGNVNIVGDQQNSEIKSGYNYASAITGVDGTTGTSSIGPAKVRGNITNSVVSASYRPGNGVYGSPSSVAGNGTITGRFAGQIYTNRTTSSTTTSASSNSTTVTTTTVGGTTVLGNQGSGFYSRFNSVHPKPPTHRKK